MTEIMDIRPPAPTYYMSCRCGGEIFFFSDVGIQCVHCEHVIEFDDLKECLAEEIQH